MQLLESLTSASSWQRFFLILFFHLGAFLPFMSWVTWNRREPAGTYDRLTRMAEWASLMLLKSTKNVFDIWWWRISWHQNVFLFYNPSCLPCFACRRFPPLSAVITLNQAKIVNIIFTNNKLQQQKRREKKIQCAAYPWPRVGVDGLLVFQLLAPPAL